MHNALRAYFVQFHKITGLLSTEVLANKRRRIYHLKKLTGLASVDRMKEVGDGAFGNSEPNGMF